MLDLDWSAIWRGICQFYYWSWWIFAGVLKMSEKKTSLNSSYYFWKAITNGYGGIRVYPEKLEFREFYLPGSLGELLMKEMKLIFFALLENVDSMHFYGVEYLGTKLTINYDNDQVSFECTNVGETPLQIVTNSTTTPFDCSKFRQH